MRLYSNAVESMNLFRRRAQREFKDKKICVLGGGVSEESNISRKTATSVLEGLLEIGYNAQYLEFSKEKIESIKNFDVVFICLHGRFGEDGTVQGMCEIFGIPYTSPDPISCAVTMNKKISRGVIGFFGLPYPKFLALQKKNFSNNIDISSVNIPFPLPYVVKPNFSGSSIGVSLVREVGGLIDSLKEAWKYSEEILIEEYLDGTEITVAVFQGKVIGSLEIKPKNQPFFSFSAKYESETEYIVPPSADKKIVEQCENFAELACSVTDSTYGAVRVDLKLDSSGTPKILEINSIPGMTKRSLVPMIAKSKGFEFSELVEAILGTAETKIVKK